MTAPAATENRGISLMMTGTPLGAADRDLFLAFEMTDAQAGEAAVVRAFTAGASADVRREDGRTPLAVAVLRGTPAMVREVLARGANPDRKTGDGEMALRLAMKYSRWESALDLVEAGANTEGISAGGGYGPLTLEAIRANRIPTATRLIASFPQETADPWPGACFAAAAEYCRDERAEVLRALTVRFVLTPQTAWEQAELIAGFGNAPAMRVMLELLAGYGAFPSPASARIASIAATAGATAVLRVQVEFGLGVSELGPAWVSAAAHGRDECLRYLLSLGVDPHACDAHRRNALHVAVRLGDDRTLRLLLDAGVSTEQVSRQQKRPFEGVEPGKLARVRWSPQVWRAWLGSVRRPGEHVRLVLKNPTLPEEIRDILTLGLL